MMMAVKWMYLAPTHLHLLPLTMVGHVLGEVLAIPTMVHQNRPLEVKGLLITW